MTMFKRLIAMLLVIAISAGLCLAFVSCGDGDDADQGTGDQGGNNGGANNGNGGVTCTAHSDGDHDGVCDTAGCSASLAINHVDTNGDGYCDVPGCNAIVSPSLCQNHVDNNGDNVCDNAGCGAQMNTDRVDYIIELKSIGGYKLSGIYLDLMNAETGDLVAYGKTDADGRLTFSNKKVANYVVAFGDGVPAGYKGQEEYVVNNNGATVITLETQLQSATHQGVSYKLGDIMHDFTLNDTEGNPVNLAELLKTKKAVVLNFWYVDCSWCVEEFPDMQAAYANYSDDIEIVAINSSDDLMKDIKDFKADLELTFPMVKETDSAILNAFGFSSFPSTVIVDRYGMISVMHSGAVLGTSYWEKLFAYLSTEEYVQKTGATFADLMPVELPTATQPSTDEIYDAFVGAGVPNDAHITFRPEDDPDSKDYAWPFVIEEYTYVDKGGNTVTDVCIVPSNSGKDSSFAIMYITLDLRAGQAVMFDIHASTEYTENFSDVFYVIVDGEPLYSRAGYEGEGAWYYHNACAFVADRDDTYEIAITYLKDEADDGDLVDGEGNTITVDDKVYLKNLRIVDASEIEALTYIFRAADEYIDSSDLVLNDNDGYYHVGSVNGPILLANLLAYTNFDPENTVSARLYSDFTLIIGGVERAAYLELYANYASNSAVYGYTSVTPELKGYLDAYAKKYSSELKIRYDENTWLMLCCYYNAYGKDENGNDVAQRPDPIKGLATFSAYDVVETVDEADPQYNTVTYDRVIMPRGYLYKFVPTTSGVYRITTQSRAQVNGWIFTGSHDQWATDGDRTLYADSEQGERYNPDLLIDPDGDGVFERDFTNASMIAYLEEGEEYYIAFGYYDLYEFSSFTFTVRMLAEEFNAFVEASPGTFTYFETEDGNVGSIIAGGINVILGDDGYYYHWKGNDENGDPILGSKVYADFLWTTSIFPTRTMQQLINAHAFNFALTESDLITLAIIVSYSKAGFEEEWLTEKYNDEGITDKTLDEYIKAMKSSEDWKAELDARWESEGLLEIEKNLYNGVACSGALFDKVKEYTRDGFLDYYGVDEADLYWESNKVDDIFKGVFHGKGENYTLEMQAIYDAAMYDENGDLILEPNNPERQGCVAVNARLAELLQMIMDKYTFENVNNSWTKLCFYYEYLGPNAD